MRALILVAGFTATATFAQISTDGSVGPRQAFTGQSITIPSTIGRQVNGNLFHSFQTFNVNGGQTVTFIATPITIDNPAMNNIISRVTGGSPSIIQGTVRSTTPGVNLYLINPSGLVIGFDAIIDVNGSFYGSTAHYLRSADGTRFETRGPGISLTFTTPDGFGFDSGAIAPIAFQGGTVRVREGATLGLVGGPISVGHPSQAATLQALGGTVAIVGVASPGVVEYGAQGFNPSGFGAMADVGIQAGATVNVNEGAGRTGSGTAYIRGRNVTIDRSTISARTAFANGGLVDLGATGDLLINQSSVVGVTTGAGNAAGMRLAGNNITLSNGTLVDTSCDPGCTTGNGGPIQVQAGGTFLIDGTAVRTSLVSNTFGRGHTGEMDITAGRLVLDGDAVIQGVGSARSLISGTQGSGDATFIRLHTGEILMQNGGQVDASTRGAGHGGQIMVDNSGAIRLVGFRVDSGSSSQGIAPSGFFASTGDTSSAFATGNAGSIAVSTRTLEVLAGAQIGSSVVNSSGAGGSITVNASESIRVSGGGLGSSTIRSAIQTNVQPSGTSAAGDITLSAPDIFIADGGLIQSINTRLGRPGSIRVTGGNLTLSGFGAQMSVDTSGGGAGNLDIHITGTLLLTTGDPGCVVNCAGISTATRGAVDGGNLVIEAGRVIVRDGAQLYSAAISSGNGGRITVHADEITVTTNGVLSAESQSPFIGERNGNAGAIELQGRTIRVTDGGRVSTSTASQGNAGSVGVHATDAILVASNGVIKSETSAQGAAGTVTVRADGTLAIQTGGRVSTSTSAIGDAGSVNVFGRNSVDISGPSSISSTTAGPGAGGTVDVGSDGTIQMSSGSISTSTRGAGNAGMVTLNAGTAVDLHGTASVTSESTSSGQAGQINVRANGLVSLSDGALVSTSTSGSGNAGVVTLYGRDTVRISSGASIASESSASGLAGNLDVRSDGTLTITSGGRITTAATFSDGGNIFIQSPQGFMDGGRITTAVGTGRGNGGNMEIRIPTFVMHDSTISANAFGGDGGNIHIGTQTFFKSANSSVTASSTLGVDGTISFDSPAIDPAGQLLPPAPAFVDAGAILAGRCGARLAGRASSLVIVPRGADGALPGGLHTTFDRAADPWYTTRTLACEPPPGSS